MNTELFSPTHTGPVAPNSPVGPPSYEKQLSHRRGCWSPLRFNCDDCTQRGLRDTRIPEPDMSMHGSQCLVQTLGNNLLSTDSSTA